MPKAIHTYEVLRRPVVTEKSTMLAAQGKYVFEVAVAANKPQIKSAVETAFDVTVKAVNTSIVRGKSKRFGRGQATRQPDWKKAIVTLAPGDQIEFFGAV
jgi:large subunit ribosomal protein L23